MKKLLILLLLFAVMLGSVGFALECTDNSLIGDVDGDGKITNLDSNLTLEFFTGHISQPANICCIDVDKDGVITSSDALQIAAIAAGQMEQPGRCVEAVCGNGICEAGEDEDNCQDDCVTCTDSDGGENIYVKGYTFKPGEGSGTYHNDKYYDDTPEGRTWHDVCQLKTGNTFSSIDGDKCEDGDDCYVLEFTCDESSQRFQCSNGCIDGACLKKESVCGNNICEPGEGTVCKTSSSGEQTCSLGTCPSDCSSCGNGVCETGEGSECKTLPSGEQTCSLGTCPQDCSNCGNNICEAGERASICTDCPSDNPSCEVTCTLTCPQDCHVEKTVRLNEKFNLKLEETAHVIDYKNMKITLDEIFTGPISCPVNCDCDDYGNIISCRTSGGSGVGGTSVGIPVTGAVTDNAESTASVGGSGGGGSVGEVATCPTNCDCDASGNVISCSGGGSGGISVPITGETPLYLGENLSKYGLNNVMDKNDLPTFLGDGKIVDSDSGTTHSYSQYVDLSPKGATPTKYTLEYNNVPGDLGESTYLFRNFATMPTSRDYFYQSYVVFVKPLGMTARGEDITLFGNEYVIGEDSDFDAKKLVLYKSQEMIILNAGQKVVAIVDGKKYEITLTGAVSSTKAVIIVNNNQMVLAKGRSYMLGGLNIYLDNVIYLSSDQTGNYAKIFIISDMLTFVDSQPVKRGMDEIVIQGTSTDVITKYGKLYGFSVYIGGKTTPPRTDYLKVSSEYKDPVWETFFIEFPSVLKTRPVSVNLRFSTVTSTNSCQGVVCPPTSKTCPDGTVVSCINQCTNGACTKCTPACSVTPPKPVKKKAVLTVSISSGTHIQPAVKRISRTTIKPDIESVGTTIPVTGDITADAEDIIDISTVTGSGGGGSGITTRLIIAEGETKSVFGAKIKMIHVGTKYVTLLITKKERPVYVYMRTDKYNYKLGEPVTISAHATGDESQLKDLQIKATVKSPNGVEYPVALEKSCSFDAECGNNLCESGEGTTCKTLPTGEEVCSLGTCPKDCEKDTKCGVNSFSLSNECDGGYRNMHVQCYDGYETTEGSETSCKDGDTWEEYAKEICEDRCLNILTCTDSDGGKDHYTKGTFSGMWNGGFLKSTDSCIDKPDVTGNDVYSSQYLGEGYCENGEVKLERITCPNGCVDGVCVKTEQISSTGAVVASDVATTLRNTQMSVVHTLPGSVYYRNPQSCDFTGIFRATKIIGPYKVIGKSDKKVNIYGTTFMLFDPSLLEKYLILKDIDGYKYIRSDSFPSATTYDVEIIQGFAALYEKGNMKYMVAVYQFRSREDIVNMLKILESEYSFRKDIINGQTVYVIQSGSYNFIVWSNKDIMVVITPLMYYTTQVTTKSIITGMTIAETPLIAADLPVPLIKTYLDKYPSDIGAVGTVCEDKGGYCTSSDSECKSGYTKTTIACTPGVCCLRKVSSNDLLDIAFKLEELSMKFDNMQRRALKLAEYYKSTENDDRYVKFKDVSDLFAQAKNIIQDTKDYIRQNIDNSELVKERVKMNIGNIKILIQNILEKILE